MANSVRILIFSSDGENFFPERSDFSADLFETFFGKTAGEACDTAVVAGETVVYLCVEFQIL